MPVRALRGAIQVDADERDLIVEAAQEMITVLLERNAVDIAQIISAIFTATPDLTAEFPAYAARLLGFVDVPLMCAAEIDVTGALPRTLRVLMHVETLRDRSEMRHAYLRGAASLRRDLPG